MDAISQQGVSSIAARGLTADQLFLVPSLAFLPCAIERAALRLSADLHAGEMIDLVGLVAALKFAINDVA
ncbi:hypothetical protein I6F33_12835 [Bradyrhizobium sp. BRP20]|uniref:hypothetical protein n=1 Tax=Bradyrhizobium TaxID=374 RepID=UPI0009DADE83|nr:hypothetical protein [Bradyrhizobium sp. BRP20]MCA1433853.1 hypothetical protein [Bradyrhizobium sp. BRP20]MCA1474141.1 hypothetical protein [Bradyrhizobium sp. NBAIM08]